MRILLIGAMVIALSGCYALKPVAWVAEDICTNRTDNENALIAEKVDEATFPHVIRVTCYEQVKE